MQTMLYILAAMSAVMVILAVAVTLTRPFDRYRRGPISAGIAIFVYIAVAAQLIITGAAALISNRPQPSVNVPGTSQTNGTTEPSTDETTETTTESTEIPEETTEATEPPTEPPVEDPRLSFQPVASESTKPENFDVKWEIAVGDEIVESYTREDPICFELDKEYFALPGIATFRGNNYRDNAAYGTAVVKNESISITWNHQIGSFNGWNGCAWTGQPLVVQWDAETKAIMTSMYEDKRSKEDLVEVIYATLDGQIHFYDMEDGSKTRDPINMGMNFKGAGALDPRGYPLLYVGSGLYVGNKGPRMFVVSLIDGTILYEHGNKDSFVLRNWTAFDSSPLVDAESDTLIWPGEAGVLYTIKLNTQYDKEAGTISVTPDDPVKTRYTSRYFNEERRYLGYESSANIVDHYLFISENGGLFQCIDLNTMELIWVQDTKDDSNSTPLFEWDDEGNGYIYTAPSLHWTAKGHEGKISIYKLDATTGEILWEYDKECVRYDDIAGGVQSSPLLGREGTTIEGMIIYAIGRTPSAYKGVLTALNKETGEVIWEVATNNYVWSSPVPLYTEDGKAYIFLCDARGTAYLIDGATGETLDTIKFNATTEASPVVFNNMIVVGTRKRVYGIKVS